MNTIGERIAYLRKMQNMTQEALATTLGVTPQTVSKWETSTTMPDILLLPIIAEVFDTSIDSLLGYKKTAEQRKIAKNDIYKVAYSDFFYTLSEFWEGIGVKTDLPLKESAEELENYIRTNKDVQTLILSYAENDKLGLYANGIFGNRDIALILRKDHDELIQLLESDEADWVFEIFSDKNVRVILKFMIENHGKFSTANAIAAKCRLTVEETEKALSDLKRLGFVLMDSVDTGDNTVAICRTNRLHKMILVYSLLIIAAKIGNMKDNYRGFMG